MLGIVGLEQWIHATRSCNLGYWLSRDASGAGLMTEAAAACLRYAFDEAGIHRVQCAAATKNRRSLAVISRLGFLPEGIARQAELVQGKWLDHAIFGKLSTD